MINSHCNLLQILFLKTDKINTSKFTLEYSFQNIYPLTLSSKIDSKCCLRSNTTEVLHHSFITTGWKECDRIALINAYGWFIVKLKFVFMFTTIISKKKWKGLWNSLPLFFFGVYVMIYLFGLFLHVKKRKKEFSNNISLQMTEGQEE